MRLNHPQAQDCVREAVQPLNKQFDFAEGLGVVMQADLAPVHCWAEKIIEEYRAANCKAPDWLYYYTAAGMQERGA